jgi:outer membrane biosynthesis protein TonB
VIAAVAVVLGVLDHQGTVDLSSAEKIAAIFGAWFLVVVADWATTRDRGDARVAGAAAAPVEAAPVVESIAPVAAGVPGPVEPIAFVEPEPEPEPDPEPEPHPERDPDPEPEPEPQPDPEPQPEPEPPVEPEPVAAASATNDAPREWNLWELERLAGERAGENPTRDEEWAFLLMYLRDFANPDGVLPVDFDALVRDSFGDLIAYARR